MPDDTAAANAATATATSTAAAATAAPAAFDWKTAGGVTDDTMVGYVQNKGWKNPADLLTSYTNLEKLHGAPERLVQLPKDDGDAAAWGSVYDKLGRPKAAADYGLTKLVPQGGDTKFAEAASAKFHELGLSAKQAEALAKFHQEFATGVTTAQTEAVKTAHAAEISALKGEWGANFDANAQLVDRAAETFGIGKAKLDALKAAMGPAEAMKFLHNLGSRLGGEGKFVDGNSANGFQGYTPDQARARVAELKSDKAWVEKYMNGDAAARKEFADLHRIISPA